MPKLGSIQDRTIRKFMTTQSELETKKVQLLALVAIQTLPPEDDRVKTIWKEYLGLEYGIDIPKHSKAEEDLIEYYDKVVKHLKPKLSRVKGKLVVSGLGKVNPNPNQQG